MATEFISGLWLRVLAIASTLAIAVSYVVLFTAACTGDTKSALGDPLAALRLESLALSFSVLGLAFAATLFLLRPGLALPPRLAHALALVMFVGLALWLLGIRIEAWG